MGINKIINKKLLLICGIILPLAMLLSSFSPLLESLKTKVQIKNPPICAYVISSVSKEEDLLALVNYNHSLDKYYSPRLVRYTDKLMLDHRAIDDFMIMLQACKDAGNQPYVCSTYRSYWRQLELYENKVKKLMDKGIMEPRARVLAARSVAYPGTSEHQLGLAVDIIDAYNGNLDESQADMPTQKWLMENSWRYGFILRYPEGKSHITGIIYEPWHYRYVGREYAKEIYESGLCFEEWLEAREAMWPIKRMEK